MPNRFTAPDEDHDDWVDVRMQEPEAGEWDVDVVVADGRVQYLDLRVAPDHLDGFLDCLVEDLAPAEGEQLLSQVAARHGLDVDASDAEDPETDEE